MNKYFRK